jgi:membrane-bound lytic murein transglycosylase B
MAINIFNLSILQADEEEGSFDDWIAHIKQLAKEKGISDETLSVSFENIERIERVIELDRKQPEFTLTLNEYLNNTVTKGRMNKGKKFYDEHNNLLKIISNEFKVQPRFILALWGIETSFGKFTGSFNVIKSLSTLSHDLRRRDFFTDELINALTIVDQGHINSDKMMGSWAGAMGQNQFMPSSFLNYATDFNKDNKKDIWNTQSDVFASTANYLSSSGWNYEQTWGREVKIIKEIDPEFVTTSAKSIEINKKIPEWINLGVVNLDGTKLPEVNIDAYLVYPEGDDGRKFLVYENFKTIMKWNRSLFFGISVGKLSDMIEYY